MSTLCLNMPLTIADTRPAELDDTVLVHQATNGDKYAFEQLYRRHVGRVYGAIWRLCGMHEARAEELTQEAFIRAWQKLGGFRFESAFSTWLYRLAINTALMALRNRDPGENVEIDVLEAACESVTHFCAGERSDIEQAIATLPDRARAVLVLHDVEGWKHEEIARELGMAVGSSKAQLHRARGLLKRMLGDSYD